MFPGLNSIGFVWGGVGRALMQFMHFSAIYAMLAVLATSMQFMHFSAIYAMLAVLATSMQFMHFSAIYAMLAVLATSVNPWYPP